MGQRVRDFHSSLAKNTAGPALLSHLQTAIFCGPDLGEGLFGHLSPIPETENTILTCILGPVSGSRLQL